MRLEAELVKKGDETQTKQVVESTELSGDEGRQWLLGKTLLSLNLHARGWRIAVLRLDDPVLAQLFKERIPDLNVVPLEPEAAETRFSSLSA
jgi:hypothetical protein